MVSSLGCGRHNGLVEKTPTRPARSPSCWGLTGDVRLLTDQSSGDEFVPTIATLDLLGPRTLDLVTSSVKRDNQQREGFHTVPPGSTT